MPFDQMQIITNKVVMKLLASYAIHQKYNFS